jgi:hypothetical protein
MKVEGGRMTEIGEMITQRYCSGRDAGVHDADERKADQHKSLYFKEITRPGTRISRITRILTDTIIRVHLCDMFSILFKDSDAINNEQVRTETNTLSTVVKECK